MLRFLSLITILATGASLAAGLPEPDKLPSQPLPAALVMLDGSPVKTPAEWRDLRAPELRSLFEHYMYGAQPPKLAAVEGKVVREDKKALGGLATLREIEVGCGLARPVHLLLVIPNEIIGNAPCFLGINFSGNHRLLDDPLIHAAEGQSERGKDKDTWCIEQTIKRGYAVASFYCGDIVTDDKVLAERDLTVFRRNGGDRGPSDTGALMAWAWGVSRMVDYLQTAEGIDGRRIAAVGHSRLGKATLLAAAFDTRIAACFPSQAGSGGSAPSRVAPELAKPNDKGRPTVETVPVITGKFPYWFCGNFSKFAGAEDKLPFDQHLLIALCAPRPVMLSNAEEDLWSNPVGQYEMLRAAAPVYALLDNPVELPDARPGKGTVINQRLGYSMRAGKHSMNAEDWNIWADYADYWLKTGRR